jgi:hypothetical protein
VREFKRDRGFLVFAQNGETDYLRLAYGLALSLRATQSEVPWLTVVITPGMEVPDHYRAVFDEVIDVPWLDEASISTWKLENEWKAYHVTPYRETIKLDADMLFTNDIKDWWPVLARQDVWICSDVETYRGELVTSDYYRRTFTSNDLPNVYTAMMYFKITDEAQELFTMAEVIYHNWERFFYEFLDDTRPDYVSTDLVFALALKLIGMEDEMTFRDFPIPRFVHMKSRLQGWHHSVPEDWSKHIEMFVTPDLNMRIGRYIQTLPVHYHLKELLTDEVIQTYERALGL